MPLAYLDLSSGLSGDIFLAALLDLGLEKERLTEGLTGLNLSGYSLESWPITRQGLHALRFKVRVSEDQKLRHLSDIREIIGSSLLPEAVKKRSMEVFELLAEAEAEVHGCEREEIHFHEVGAVDSIIDIVGVNLALHLLKIDTIYASEVPLGTGFVDCAHGRIPVPVPATTRLLKGVPCYGTGIRGELVTPTGAALLAALVEDFGPLPAMTIEAVGHGAGSSEFEIPNIMRIFLGTPKAESSDDRVLIFTTVIDDLNPEVIPYLRSRLFKSGVLDFYLTPVQMKKGRPGFELVIMLPPSREEEVAEVLFTESSTLGLRVSEERRITLSRQHQSVSTPLGPVRIKLGLLGERVINVAPEFEDCRELAEREGVPLKEVQQQALTAYFSLCQKGQGD